MKGKTQTKRPRSRQTAERKKPAVFKNNTPKKIILYNTIPSMPDEFDTVIKAFGKVTSASSGLTSVQFLVYTNSLLHSADSFTNAVSSTTLSNIGRNYTKYRVVGYKINYTLAAQDTSPYHFLEYHAPVDPAFPTGAAFANEAVTRDKAKYHFVPSTTQYPNVLTSAASFKLMQVVGEEEFEQEASYAGGLNSSGVPTDPVDLTYLVLHLGKVSGATFNGTALPDIILTLTQYVRFYDKRV